MKTIYYFMLIAMLPACSGNQSEENPAEIKVAAQVYPAITEEQFALGYLDILPKLYLLGITPADSLPLEFFIRSTSYKNALELSETVKETYLDGGMDAELGCTDSTKEGYKFQGKTNKIRMDSASVLARTKELLTLCSAHGCIFKGWGAVVQPAKDIDIVQKVLSDSALAPIHKK